MKKDNLEQFIFNNREKFDQQAPNPKIWAAIDSQLPKEKKRIFPIRRFLSIAASIVFLVGIGMALGLYLSNPPTPSLSNLYPEQADVEQFYKGQINRRLKQLANHSNGSVFQKDLQELDTWLIDLQKELLEVPKGKREVIINTIIETYKLKLSILEEALEEVKTLEQEADSNNEKVHI